MKKLILSAAIVLGSLTTYASSEINDLKVLSSISLQEEYNEVKLDAVPAAITAALKTAYPDAILDKAYVNAKKQYKLNVSIGEQKGNLYADESGKWIQK